MQRLSGANAEASMMQRAAQRVIGREAIDECTMIVSAIGAAGENGITSPQNDDIFVTDRSQDPSTVGQIAKCDAAREVRFCIVSHGWFPGFVWMDTSVLPALPKHEDRLTFR